MRAILTEANCRGSAEMRAIAAIAIGILVAFAQLSSGQNVSLAAPNQFAINVDADGNAVHGYDTVAYFALGSAAKGDPRFAHTWKGARWLFTTAGHRDMFAADPERYAPRIGGFCAVGAVNGTMVEVDPRMWLIIRDRLYLYLNANVRQSALDNLEDSTKAAEAEWTKLQSRPQ